MAQAPPGRFYDKVSVAAVSAGYVVRLDDAELMTPQKTQLVLPHQALADAVAEEWRGQGGRADPGTMPVTRLANTAIDRIALDKAPVLAELVEYAGSDLICYRASEPPGLVERQQQHWDPVLGVLDGECNLRFGVVTGIAHESQDAAMLGAFENLMAKTDPFDLAACYQITVMTGSALLALARQIALLDDEQVWAAAHVDEDWQAEQWGIDEEAQARRAGQRADFAAACRVLDMAPVR